MRPVTDLNAREVLLRRHMVVTPAAMEQIKVRFGAQVADTSAADTSVAETSVAGAQVAGGGEPEVAPEA